VLKADIMGMFHDFPASSKFEKSLNATFIALIPKRSEAILFLISKCKFYKYQCKAPLVHTKYTRNKHLNTDPPQTTSHKTYQTPEPLKLSTHKLILPNMLLIKGREESHNLILLPLGPEPYLGT
jgi:hypothetical protein